MQKYFHLQEIINLIDEPNRSVCQRILKENDKLFKTAPGSSHNHQNWSGGYWDHIQEVMNIAVVLYQKMNPLRTLPFSLSDALLVLFLHNLKKPWKYEADLSGELRRKKDMKTRETDHKRMMGPLATFCHICDLFSAGIWFAYPLDGFEDSWWPAQRVNSER